MTVGYVLTAVAVTSLTVVAGGVLVEVAFASSMQYLSALHCSSQRVAKSTLRVVARSTLDDVGDDCDGEEVYGIGNYDISNVQFSYG